MINSVDRPWWNIKAATQSISVPQNGFSTLFPRISQAYFEEVEVHQLGRQAPHFYHFPKKWMDPPVPE